MPEQVRVVECYSEPHAFVEVSQATPWRLLHINHAALRVTGGEIRTLLIREISMDGCPMILGLP